VGQALARVLAPLPFALTGWTAATRSSRPGGADTLCEHSDPVQAAVPSWRRSPVLIMSFSHAEDLDVVAACLARQRERADLPFIGLIGSRPNGPPSATACGARVLRAGAGPGDLPDRRAASPAKSPR
jgi:xanthine dehydrogenase accessory factor